ncbi:MAG: hypothetical protein IKP96_01885 [Elusimicrobiaceae bacterium]|nr:hypothetical protein [Elusimicrobiaceae bacterium]
MSKKSYFFIAVMLTALLFMGAVRGYQFYAHKAAEWEEKRIEQTAAFSFQQVPLSLAAPKAEPVSAPQPFVESQLAPVFLGDVPLSEEQTVRQAQDTLRSIVQDFQQEPEIQSFNRDLAQATKGQAIDLSSLSGGNLAQILQDNPRIKEVVSKHMQNPDFAQKVQEIFSNPQFVQSVRQLQRYDAPAATDKKQTK